MDFYNLERTFQFDDEKSGNIWLVDEKLRKLRTFVDFFGLFRKKLQTSVIRKRKKHWYYYGTIAQQREPSRCQAMNLLGINTSILNSLFGWSILRVYSSFVHLMSK